MKDREDINHCIYNKPNFIRKCHKYYDLRTIASISTKKADNDRLCISIVFSIGTDLEKLEYKTKLFYFFIPNGKRFIQILNYYLKKLHIDINFTDNE